MKKRFLLCATTLFSVVAILSAQNKSAGINLSLWQGAATQPHDSVQTTYVNWGLFSRLNALNGMSANVLGCEVDRDMNGVQLTGLANLVGGTMRGLQLAGISNVSGDNLVGVSAAGLVNIVGERANGVLVSGLTTIGGSNVSGMMLSGVLNLAGDVGTGWQLSGLANIARDYNGMQISGLLNLAGEDANGMQLAGLANLAGERMDGMQLALCNYATRLRGVQIGLVNYYREDLKGVQLGLVNANPNTRVQPMLYGGSAALSNVGVRFRNKLLYTMLGLSAMHRHLNDRFSAGLFYRTGISVPLVKRLSLNGDLGYEHIEAMNNKDEVIPRRLYALQLRTSLEYRLSSKFALFATGGYGWMRSYRDSANLHKGALAEMGMVLF